MLVSEVKRQHVEHEELAVVVGIVDIRCIIDTNIECLLGLYGGRCQLDKTNRIGLIFMANIYLFTISAFYILYSAFSSQVMILTSSIAGWDSLAVSPML